MKTTPKRLTVNELSLVLNISEKTLKILHKTKQLPGVYIKRQLFFDFEKMLKHFQNLEGGAA